VYNDYSEQEKELTLQSAILVFLMTHRRRVTFTGRARGTCAAATRHRFLGAFAKLRKASISLVVSVRLSAWNNSASTIRILMKFEI
jgi:hypothetical protein